MSTPYPQHALATQSANIQQLFTFSTKVFDGFEKLTALNLQVFKATLAENYALSMKALSSRPDELLALSASLAMPTAEKCLAYSRHVEEILADVRSGVALSGQSQPQRYQRDARGFVADLTKVASAGTDIGVTE
ncbi:phasin family protein [Paraburkholderia sp. GAS199]|uniref:TIGR01841 family phasin n=1 Tax=Paraburkholderia sp. GAS199 TaxID=3035126 RepID=UPI003D23E7E8